MTAMNGKPCKKPSSTTTTIPHSVFAAIAQTKSSPETIAALLNDAEAIHSSLPRHGNAKRAYPFWKICKTCSQPFPCQTREQAVRNRHCSRKCTPKVPGKKKPLAQRKGKTVVCARCGTKFWRPDAWLRKVNQAYCSPHCRAVAVTGPILVANKFDRTGMKFPGTGLKGKMNPAWKGGVTYFRKHGNYKPIKYVRCPVEFLPMARKDGYVMEHRLIVAREIGRCLLRSEVVHHRNHDPQDNSLSNLELFASN